MQLPPGVDGTVTLPPAEESDDSYEEDFGGDDADECCISGTEECNDSPEPGDEVIGFSEGDE
jgi:hypothetical protein